MLIGITGDTHGSYKAMFEISEKKLPVKTWLHTGDFYADARTLEKLTGVPVEAVFGNNDFGGTPFDYEKTVFFENQKIWLTHGHRYHSDLLEKAKDKKANIVVYGHTHVPDISWHDDVLFINPGSPSYPRRSSRPSFAVLELLENTMPEVRLHTI